MLKMRERPTRIGRPRVGGRRHARQRFRRPRGWSLALPLKKTMSKSFLQVWPASSDASHRPAIRSSSTTTANRWWKSGSSRRSVHWPAEKVISVDAANVTGIVVASRTTPFGGPFQRKGSSAYASCTIWIRLPQVSSRTAVVTSPISVGSWVNLTPFDRSRSNSA